LKITIRYPSARKAPGARTKARIPSPSMNLKPKSIILIKPLKERKKETVWRTLKLRRM
jgi:hypothetical protein